jgi:hypothetical protein
MILSLVRDAGDQFHAAPRTFADRSTDLAIHGRRRRDRRKDSARPLWFVASPRPAGGGLGCACACAGALSEQKAADRERPHRSIYRHETPRSLAAVLLALPWTCARTTPTARRIT